jgi:hypothetical protein
MSGGFLQRMIDGLWRRAEMIALRFNPRSSGRAYLQELHLLVGGLGPEEAPGVGAERWIKRHDSGTGHKHESKGKSSRVTGRLPPASPTESGPVHMVIVQPHKSNLPMRLLRPDIDQRGLERGHQDTHALGQRVDVPLPPHPVIPPDVTLGRRQRPVS